MSDDRVIHAREVEESEVDECLSRGIFVFLNMLKHLQREVFMAHCRKGREDVANRGNLYHHSIIYDIHSIICLCDEISVNKMERRAPMAT